MCRHSISALLKGLDGYRDADHGTHCVRSFTLLGQRSGLFARSSRILHAGRVLMRAMRTYFAIPMLLVAVFGAQANEVLRYDGTARDASSGELLYRETHYLEQSSEQLNQRLVLYRCADNDKVFARKRVRYGQPNETPDFELIDARLGYREGLQRNRDQSLSTFVQRDRFSSEDREALPPERRFVADAGFDEFLKVNWEKLQRGDEVRLNFLVPAELGTIAFKIRKHHEERIDGRAASVIRLSLGAWWGFIAPHIDAAYDQQTQTLLRYEGLSNLRGSNGRNLNVRVDFPPELRRASDAASLQQASAQRLSVTCAAAPATKSPVSASP